MARDEPTHEPVDVAGLVADAALSAADVAAVDHGTTLKEAIVLVRLGDDRAASAGHREHGDVDGEWLAGELLYRFERVMEALGKSVHVGFLDEPGRG